MRTSTITFRSVCAASAAALVAAFPAPAHAASAYKRLTAAQLKRVAAAVTFPDSSKTEVLGTLRGDELDVERICGAVFPAGRAGFHLVEEADGADRAVVIILQT